MIRNPPRCDIFCKVIDNYGDAGVCWRLAAQLANEFGWQVRLWIDEPATLHKLIGTLDSTGVPDVEIRFWPTAFPAAVPADVVIEAFACVLPDVYIASMAAQPHPPVWLNLEYLSAEDWANECHALPSPHSRLPLIKYFFFPGFTPDSGGLLRERDYAARRAAFNDAIFRREFELGARHPDLMVISLFIYANPALAALIEVWSRSPTPIQVLCPGLTDARYATGAAELVPLPFLPQRRYDELLWASDLNFVRGEDSFVRAQWAAKPFVWQIYPQEQEAHFAKLDAFLARFEKVGAGDAANGPHFADAEAIRSMKAFWYAWNGHGDLNWPDFARCQPALRQQAKEWHDTLAKQTELATNLVQFCLPRLK